MQRMNLARRIRTAILLLLVLTFPLAAIACRHTGDDPVTLPDTLPVTDLPTESETDAPPPTPASLVKATTLAASTLPDYSDYTSASRIREALSAGNTYAFTLSGVKYYRNGELLDGGGNVLSTDSAGDLTVNGAALGALIGQDGLADGTPAALADALDMQVSIYDDKTVLFYDGNLPLHTYEDIYTYEAMRLYMIGASEEELRNALIDLPDRISNGSTNTVFYTDSDLNLGVQISVYHAQMGDVEGITPGPSLVAGEGRHESNYTTVRIFNDRQTCITQFLAYSPAVTGGVQVAAAAVGEETLIATAPFASHSGEEGDVRVYDAFGLLRMTLNVRELIPGPHTILTGRFDPAREDEVLLIVSQTTDAEGKLPYAIISLTDSSLITAHALDCSFALPEDAARATVNLSVRRSATEDSVILHFPTVQAVYEGSAASAAFENAGITLPADATAVSATDIDGARYTVSLPARDETEDQSFLTIYDEDAASSEQDVGFRENRFFSALFTDGFNDGKYVSRGDFCHIRTDLSNNAMAGIPAGAAAIDTYFDLLSYSDYTCWESEGNAARLATDYLFLEPCFTHRWNKTYFTANLASYVDPETGKQRYVSVGKDGEYTDYNELGSEYYVGTYADGILELAKLRLYPLRQFLQTSVTAFRGENGNPEHLVGISPVHEHEINVPGSVGDYNDAMIEGFRLSMLARYGSIENINALFGTSFVTAEELDAPRDQGRGDWDAYSGDYFTEWTMYNRTIVSTRIMEAYREALLAGYPPEAISAHQMPEGEAVGGFLGDAATRLTPVDTVLTCGTAYGGTRYGTFYQDGNNFVRYAQRLGHFSTTIGEYCARTASADVAYAQIKDLWSRGVRMVHHVTLGDTGFAAAEAEAIRRLSAENTPRPGYTGGTSGTLDIGGEDTYRIVQIGAGADTKSVGLLKSIDAEGKWEGTVYLVPFHTKMVAKDLPAIQTPLEGSDNRFSTGAQKTLKNADQIEVTLQAATSTPGATLTFEVYHKGCRIEDATTVYTLNDTMTPYRFVLSNQLREEGLEIVVTFDGPSGMEGIEYRELTATLQTEKADFYYYNRNATRNCAAHVGGVTFDVLDRDRLYGYAE